MAALYNPVRSSFQTRSAWAAKPRPAAAKSSAPVFGRATQRLPNGKTFCAVGAGAPAQNAGVKAIGLNRQPLDRPCITCEDIMAGGERRFELAPAN